MFTGIIQSLGTITAITDTPAGKRLTVNLGPLANEPIQLGDSIAVSGICLTVTALDKHLASFDVITETLHRTTLGQKSPGDPINLELSLRPTSFVGGHFVQGHIDALSVVSAVQQDLADWRITFRVPPELMPYFVPKGSVAVDGVSMTIASVTQDSFTLAVIPTTLERTTLGSLRPGHTVNVETDILARTVIRALHAHGIGKPISETTADPLVYTIPSLQPPHSPGELEIKGRQRSNLGLGFS